MSGLHGIKNAGAGAGAAGAAAGAGAGAGAGPVLSAANAKRMTVDNYYEELVKGTGLDDKSIGKYPMISSIIKEIFGKKQEGNKGLFEEFKQAIKSGPLPPEFTDKNIPEFLKVLYESAQLKAAAAAASITDFFKRQAVDDIEKTNFFRGQVDDILKKIGEDKSIELIMAFMRHISSIDTGNNYFINLYATIKSNNANNYNAEYIKAIKADMERYKEWTFTQRILYQLLESLGYNFNSIKAVHTWIDDNPLIAFKLYKVFLTDRNLEKLNPFSIRDYKLATEKLNKMANFINGLVPVDPYSGGNRKPVHSRRHSKRHSKTHRKRHSKTLRKRHSKTHRKHQISKKRR